MDENLLAFSKDDSLNYPVKSGREGVGWLSGFETRNSSLTFQFLLTCGTKVLVAFCRLLITGRFTYTADSYHEF